MKELPEQEILKAKLHGSFLLFCQTFYPLLTGRPFMLSNPISRESHFITLSKAFTKCGRLEWLYCIINMPPGHGKTTMACLWVAWMMSQYPDSRFMYVSYTITVATKATQLIKDIMSLPQYKILFGIYIKQDSKAKHAFQTTAGGEVRAFGSDSSVTGFDAGLPGLLRFSGAIIYDDAHKVSEAASDSRRNNVIQTYLGSISTRKRGVNVPILLIGQRVHESDLAAFLLKGKDGINWEKVILKSIDDAGNALYPEAFPLEDMLRLQKFNIYNFASQFQQNPQPAGGSLFKPEFFFILPEEPQFLCTFITADTAETSNPENDATALSFWGLYKVKTLGMDTETLSLHWIYGVECRVEPKDLKDVFLDFWDVCAKHKKPPRLAAIEKKSTGVTLLSILHEMRGLEIRNIERGSRTCKTQRFLNMQPYAAQGLISFTEGSTHVENCIEHMRKITINDTHEHDDLCDTAADAVQYALIDKLLYTDSTVSESNNLLIEKFTQRMKNYSALRSQRYGAN